MSDLISRQAAISAICNACGKIDCDKMDKCEKLQLPPASCSEFPNNSDTISRQAVLNEFCHSCDGWSCNPNTCCKTEWIRKLPVIQPEIIRCRECKFASGDNMRIVIDISEYDKEWIGNAYGIPQDINTKIAEAIINAELCQPEPHWIPIDLENNEPPLEEWVLVSSDGYVMQDCIVDRGGKKIWYHGGNIQVNDRYMPLPEPYKGVTE